MTLILGTPKKEPVIFGTPPYRAYEKYDVRTFTGARCPYPSASVVVSWVAWKRLRKEAVKNDDGA